MMKKQYITPETEIFNLQIEGALLAGSVFEPTIWKGGGGADSRFRFRDIVLIIRKGDRLSSLSPFSCDSRGIQTHNLLIRSQMLYSVELGSLPFCFAVAKVHTFYGTAKLFRNFF